MIGGRTDADVLIVGGGPAGSATAIGLARAGHRVVLLEKRPHPRHKSCGDLLTPRAVGELAALDVDVAEITPPAHRLDGVRLVDARTPQLTHGVEVDWPPHPDLGAIGYGVRRNVLDEHLRQAASEAGASVLMGHEATLPLIDRGFVRGADVDIVSGNGEITGQRTLTARFVVVADGAHSAFGRSLGTTRQRRWPYGVATRTYFNSPRHHEHRMETTLSLPGQNGHPISGYGWVVPLGDGTVNVGIGVSSASRDVIGVNALRLLTRFANDIAPRWEFDPEAPLKDPTRLRLPLGGSVGPVMGPTFLVVGDAGGLANPLDGDGIDAALVSARHAAAALHRALAGGSSTALQQYATTLNDELGEYHHVARLATRLLGRPSVLRLLVSSATRSPAAAGGVLRVATRALREDAGAVERLYRTATRAARLAPSA